MRSDSGLEGARRKFPNREMARHTPEIEKRHFGSRAKGTYRWTGHSKVAKSRKHGWHWEFKRTTGTAPLTAMNESHESMHVLFVLVGWTPVLWEHEEQDWWSWLEQSIARRCSEPPRYAWERTLSSLLVAVHTSPAPTPHLIALYSSRVLFRLKRSTFIFIFLLFN